jgi:hypothetical protein
VAALPFQSSHWPKNFIKKRKKKKENKPIFKKQQTFHGTSSKLEVEEILYHVSSFECLDLQTC